MAHLPSHRRFLLTEGQGSHLVFLGAVMMQTTLLAFVCCLGSAIAQSTLAFQGSATHRSPAMLHCKRTPVELGCKVVAVLFAVYEQGC